MALPPPPAKLYMFGLMVPTWLIIFQVISHKVAHHISPLGCGPAGKDARYTLLLIVKSVQYFCVRIPKPVVG